MKSISVTELRVNLMNTLEEVKRGKTIIVTSHGKPIAQITSPPDKRKDAIARLKTLRKTIKIVDIVSPVGESWKTD